MSFEFRPAVRERVGLLIGLAGPSGGGKTFSAMRLAAGMTPPGKRFAVIDTEAGRAKHYADQFKFDHGELKPPFRPSAYADAIKAADEAGYPVIIVDSCSHEHAGEGGLLDWQEEELDRMAGNDYHKREACKMAAWVKPKMAHKQMVQRLLQVRAHLILCFRAEQKVEMVRGASGRMEIQPKKIASGFSDWIPICEKNLLYELTASFLLTPDKPGIPQPIKLQEQHRDFFPAGQAISEQAGQRLAAWASGGAASSSSSQPARADRQPPATSPAREEARPQPKPLPVTPPPASQPPSPATSPPPAGAADQAGLAWDAPAGPARADGAEHPLFSEREDKLAALQRVRGSLSKPIPDDVWTALCTAKCGSEDLADSTVTLEALDELYELIDGISKKAPASIREANELVAKARARVAS